MIPVITPLSEEYEEIGDVPSHQEVVFMEEQRKVERVAQVAFSAAAFTLFMQTAPVTLPSVFACGVTVHLLEGQVRAPLGRALNRLSYALQGKEFPAAADE